MQIQSIIYNTETTISIIATLTVASLVMMLTGVVCLLNIVHARHRKSKKAYCRSLLANLCDRRSSSIVISIGFQCK